MKKLSPKQKEVIQKMREGEALFIGVRGVTLVDANDKVTKVNTNVFLSLQNRSLIKWREFSARTGNSYSLTDLGKTIEL